MIQPVQFTNQLKIKLLCIFRINMLEIDRYEPYRISHQVARGWVKRTSRFGNCSSMPETPAGTSDNNDLDSQQTQGRHPCLMPKV